MIFYFHGFSSGANSQKANAIKNELSEYPVFIPEYPSHQPHHAISDLESYITTHCLGDPSQKIMLMGSSLGGFYAQYLARHTVNVTALVLINPCLQPWNTLVSQIGEQKNIVTGEAFNFTQQDLDNFTRFDVPRQELFSPSLVLLDQGDEIIDYRIASDNYSHKGRVIAYPGGDHWFRHLDQALPEIKTFYQKTVMC